MLRSANESASRPAPKSAITPTPYFLSLTHDHTHASPSLRRKITSRRFLAPAPTPPPIPHLPLKKLRRPSSNRPKQHPPGPNRPTTPRAPSSRLWNPQNFSPRTLAVPNVPVEHPDLAQGDRPRPQTAGEYPLLTLPEQRRSRQSLKAPSSLAVERSSADLTGSQKTSIGIPENRRSGVFERETGEPKSPREQEPRSPREQVPQDFVLESAEAGPGPSTSAARAEAVAVEMESKMDTAIQSAHGDLESGRPSGVMRTTTSRASLPLTPPRHNENQDVEHNSEEDEEFAWGPSHPCFPHPNPHVPLDSPLYNSTRVIRIRRDWMQVGDLAPTFTNLYPEVLDPLITEEEFRRVIKKINDTVIEALSPYSVRAWTDAILGVATLWLWEDLGFAGVKGKLTDLERWIEIWNRDFGSKEGVVIIPLRRTAYMSIDIQIPDPHIGLDPGMGASRPATRGTDINSMADLSPYPVHVGSTLYGSAHRLPTGVTAE